MFVLSWKLTAVTIALAPLCILAAVISSYISSNLKSKRLAADSAAAAIARLSLQQPAAVKALCIEDAVAAHYGALHDVFITSFSPSKNSVCRVLVSTSFQVAPPASASSTALPHAHTPPLPPDVHCSLHLRWLPAGCGPASASHALSPPAHQFTLLHFYFCICHQIAHEFTLLISLLIFLTHPPPLPPQVQPGFLVSFFLFLVVLASSIGQLPAVRVCAAPHALK